jgi:hypothetical protein
MKGSLTYKFMGDSHNYRVNLSRPRELDSEDLEVIAALLKKASSSKRQLNQTKSNRLRWTPKGRCGITGLTEDGLRHW